MKGYEVYQINKNWTVKHEQTGDQKTYGKSKREAELAIRFHMRNKRFPEMI